MNLKLLVRQQKNLLASLFALTVSGCITIHDATLCSVAGQLSAGGICGHLLTDETSDLTFDEFLNFLSATEEHAAAVCMSSDDWSQMKTSLEQACRMLGRRCKRATLEKIINFNLVRPVNH